MIGSIRVPRCSSHVKYARASSPRSTTWLLIASVQLRSAPALKKRSSSIARALPHQLLEELLLKHLGGRVLLELAPIPPRERDSSFGPRENGSSAPGARARLGEPSSEHARHERKRRLREREREDRRP